MPPEVEDAVEDVKITDSEEFKKALATAVADQVSAETKKLNDSITNLEAVNGKLKEEKTTVANEFKEFQAKFEGIDIDAIQQKLEQAETEEFKTLLSQGKIDEVFEKKTALINVAHEKDKAKIAAAHENAINDLQKQLDEIRSEAEGNVTRAQVLEKTLVSTVRDGGITQAFINSNADASQLRSVKAIAKDTVRVKDEFLPVVEVDNAGVPTFRNSETGEVLQAAEGEFDFSSWLKHLAENEGLPLYAKPNGHSDPSAITDANPQGLVKSKMDDQAKRDFKKQHGIDAYNALPYS